MSLSVYLWGIRLFTLFALFAYLGVVIALDPTETGSMGRGLFFVSLFALLTGILTLFVTWTYRKALGDTGAAHHLNSAFRQALLLSLYALGIVFFQYAGLLTWWDALLLLAAVLLVEFSLRRFLEDTDK
jgi:predicted ABC-type exoprotein transport system permease subunit